MSASAGGSPRARARGEDGNMVIAMVVLLVLTNLALAVLARTLVTMEHTRTSQDFNAALAVADAGLSDALFRLDQGPTNTWTTGPVTSGGGAYTYRATRNASDDSFTVESKGTVARSTHAIRAKIVRSSAFQFALFSNQQMTFNGGITDITSSISLGGAVTGKAHVGSNDGITVNGGHAGDFQDAFKGSPCVGCPAPVTHLDEFQTPLVDGVATAGKPVLTVPTTGTQPCPAGGLISGPVNGFGTGVAFQPMVCGENVVITGTVSVINPPFELWIKKPTSGAAYSLTVSGALINTTGAASNFKVFKAGNGALDLGTASTLSTLTFSGVLYAPESNLTISGSKSLAGSLILNQLDVQGAPTLKIGYDDRLQSIKGTDWTVTRYTEVPTSSLNF